jgi:hypothetical protein
MPHHIGRPKLSITAEDALKLAIAMAVQLKLACAFLDAVPIPARLLHEWFVLLLCPHTRPVADIHEALGHLTVKTCMYKSGQVLAPWTY